MTNQIMNRAVVWTFAPTFLSRTATLASTIFNK